MSDLQVLQLSRYDRLGGSSRLRFYDYGALLADHGIHVTPAPFFDDEYLQRLYAGERCRRFQVAGYYLQRVRALVNTSKYDVVWLEKEALPWLPAFAESSLLARTPYVVDFDDAWFHRYDRHRSALVRLGLKTKFPAIVRRAAAVVAGSPYLAEWAAARGAHRIVRIPTTVDLARYRTKQAGVGNGFVIGWMGSPSSARYLDIVRDALREVAAAPGTSVRLVGSGAAADLDATVLPWREASEAEDLLGFDIGIMPLTRDEWSEGKCAYKLIQYMAAGLPVVASPVGMNREVVQHGVNGFLAETSEEWVTALRRLREDPALRARMGAAGRKAAEAEYSLAGTAPLLAETLREAAAGPQGRRHGQHPREQLRSPQADCGADRRACPPSLPLVT